MTAANLGFRFRKNIGLATVLLFPALIVVGAGKVCAAQTIGQPHVVILTTGGTIAGSSQGLLSGQEVILAVPSLEDLASFSVEEVFRIGSSQMTPEHWKQLGNKINKLLDDRADITGVVVTHGTDTMEETGYYLNLVVDDERPVVLVGSMRSSNAVSADGPANLLNAVRVAIDPDARGRGVMIVLNDEIHSARAVFKSDNQRVQAFSSGQLGLLGNTDYDTVIFYRYPSHRHTVTSLFSGQKEDDLPVVPIIADFAGYDGSTIQEWIDRGAMGIVLQSFAGGRMSRGARDAVESAVLAGIPVVIASRVSGGRIPGTAGVEGAILATSVSAQKARVLLILALGDNLAQSELQSAFDQH
ncbi:MAG: L-asparaginase [Rhodothermales bacterium]|jgi:L-asparaginase